MKNIKIKLDPNSVDDAIAELKAYRASLMDKLKILIGQLVQDGVEIARVKVSASQGDSTDAYVDYTVSPEGDIVKASIFLQGTEALFIEFGAGIAYNTGEQHPKADEFGYGPGTYPSKHPPNKAINPGYWFYRDDSKNLQKSIGTEATMPIYHAGNTIRNNLIQKAIENFVRG